MHFQLRSPNLTSALKGVYVFHTNSLHTTLDCSSLLQRISRSESLDQAKQLHAYIVRSGFRTPLRVLNSLLTLYSRFSPLQDTCTFFSSIPNPNVCSWTILIAAHIRHGFPSGALSLFGRMKTLGISPSKFTYSAVIPAIGKLGLLEDALQIHQIVIREALQVDSFVASALLEMFANLRRMDIACKVFDKMSERDVVHWNGLIAGLLQNGETERALEVFHKMSDRDAVSWNTVIALCAQNGLVDEALRLFQEMPRDAVNSVTWNGIVAGFSQSGNCREAIRVYEKMRAEGVFVNSKTISSVLSACAQLKALDYGMQVQEEALRNGTALDVIAENALIGMYAKCGCMDSAERLFRNMPKRTSTTWNTMIACYVQNREFEEAWNLFSVMESPDVVSWTVMIVACFENGFMDRALELFEKMPKKDVAVCTAMIEGLARSGQAHRALDFYRKMKQQLRLKPDPKVFVPVLQLCGSIADLHQGMNIHQEIKECGFQNDIKLVNSLLDMYAKCGRMDMAYHLFSGIDHKDMISWNTMIAGYAMNGLGNEALTLFHEMQRCAVNPSHATFVSVLEACCHSGFVEEGLRVFENMDKMYGLTPAMQHYVCIVDLLGRAGRLKDAAALIGKMPMPPSAAVWRSFLGACSVHCNLELGKWASSKIIELEPNDGLPYVLLSNIYAATGRWDEVQRMRKMMREKGLIKKPGSSWIEVKGELHAFTAGGGG